MHRKRCLACDVELPEGSSSRRRYCSDACRTAAGRRSERSEIQALGGRIAALEGRLEVLEEEVRSKPAGPSRDWHAAAEPGNHPGPMIATT